MGREVGSKSLGQSTGRYGAATRPDRSGARPPSPVHGERSGHGCHGGGDLDGDVEMDHNFALSAADLERGYVLTCQSHPTTPTVAVDYDQ